MPHPWNIDDAVQVKIGDLWCDAVVSSTPRPGVYTVALDEPLPSLDDCGMTHPRVATATKVRGNVLVSHASAALEGEHDRIRDPI